MPGRKTEEMPPVIQPNKAFRRLSTVLAGFPVFVGARPPGKKQTTDSTDDTDGGPWLRDALAAHPWYRCDPWKASGSSPFLLLHKAIYAEDDGYADSPDQR